MSEKPRLCPLAVLSVLCGLIVWVFLSMPLSDPPVISREGEMLVYALVVICAISAIGLALASKYRIARGQGRLKGVGLARTGFWLGMLPCILLVVLLIVSVFGGARR